MKKFKILSVLTLFILSGIASSQSASAQIVDQVDGPLVLVHRTFTFHLNDCLNQLAQNSTGAWSCKVLKNNINPNEIVVRDHLYYGEDQTVVRTQFSMIDKAVLVFELSKDGYSVDASYPTETSTTEVLTQEKAKMAIGQFFENTKLENTSETIRLLVSNP